MPWIKSRAKKGEKYPLDPTRKENLYFEEVTNLKRAGAVDRVAALSGTFNDSEIFDRPAKRLLLQGGTVQHAGKDESSGKDIWKILWSVRELRSGVQVEKLGHLKAGDLRFLGDLKTLTTKEGGEES